METTDDRETAETKDTEVLADVPMYAPPPTVIMGDVQQVGMGAQQGIVAAVTAGRPMARMSDDALVADLEERRQHLAERIKAIEELLGFVAVADDLAVRVAKIEKFVGIAG